MNYTIIEIANTHAGDLNYFNELISTYSEYGEGFGMKFQPFSADTIATDDFSWYSVYQELYFTPSEWKEIIKKTKQTKDVWLDLFDVYGVQILKENLSNVDGIKLQVSVLFNNEVISALGKLKLHDKKMIINVAALDEADIKHFINRINAEVKPEELLIEVGFQSFPTELLDSGLSKIAKIKSICSNRVVFADHVSKDDEYAILLPALAVASGADVIEKHVMLQEAKYDHFSSLNPEQFKKMVSILKTYSSLQGKEFINQKEREYLQNSIMKPILTKDVAAGNLLSMDEDMQFRRSGQSGLNSKEISELQSNFHILRTSKKAGNTILPNDFKKSNIAVIVAGRLKSSRLKSKALKKIGDLSSVEYCLKNACKFKNVNHVILATSTLESDAELSNHTFDESVIFHKGHPDDVVQRYLDITRALKIDVVIRVTADMPYIDDEICQILLEEHFKTGADYTAGKSAAVGTNLEIISTQALEKVKSHFPSADYSEYMTWYFMNNQEHFKINLVDLPEDLVRDYRLTLDYQEDLDLFNQIHDKLKEKEDYGIRDVFKLLDSDPKLPEINSHITLKYKTDQELINTLNKVTKMK